MVQFESSAVPSAFLLHRYFARTTYPGSTFPTIRCRASTLSGTSFVRFSSTKSSALNPDNPAIFASCAASSGETQAWTMSIRTWDSDGPPMSYPVPTVTLDWGLGAVSICVTFRSKRVTTSFRFVVGVYHVFGKVLQKICLLCILDHSVFRLLDRWRRGYRCVRRRRHAGYCRSFCS